MTVSPRPLHRTARPIGEPAPTVLVWAAAFFGSSLVLLVLGASGALHRPAISMAILCLFAGAVSMCAPARAVAAPGTALVCWLLFDGFVANRGGDLTWGGYDDLRRVALLTAAALLGTAVARASAACAAYRRLRARDFPAEIEGDPRWASRTQAR